MKKTFTIIIASLAFALAANAGDVMIKKADGTYVVNTTTICNAKGFKGATPLEVHIRNGKVVKVVSLANKETKAYYAKAEKGFLGKLIGLKTAKAEKIAKQPKVDGCTGATYSTAAMQKNVEAALDYYKKHK